MMKTVGHRIAIFSAVPVDDGRKRCAGIQSS